MEERMLHGPRIRFTKIGIIILLATCGAVALGSLGSAVAGSVGGIVAILIVLALVAWDLAARKVGFGTYFMALTGTVFVFSALTLTFLGKSGWATSWVASAPRASMAATGSAGAPKPAPGIAQSFRVIPGVGVGPVILGRDRTDVLAALGNPKESDVVNGNLHRDTWYDYTPSVDEMGTPVENQRFVSVIYRDNRVAQISYNSPRFVTVDGLSMSASLINFRSTYPAITRRDLNYTAYCNGEAAGGHVQLYFDDEGAGICFSFGVQDDFPGTSTADIMYVHESDIPVIPEPGGEMPSADAYVAQETTD